jgi:hypothetical protein
VLGPVGAGCESALGRLGTLRLFTVTLPGLPSFGADSIDASPQITSILFFFMRKATPSARRFETPRERFTTAPISAETVPSIFRP